MTRDECEEGRKKNKMGKKKHKEINKKEVITRTVEKGLKGRGYEDESEGGGETGEEEY